MKWVAAFLLTCSVAQAQGIVSSHPGGELEQFLMAAPKKQFVVKATVRDSHTRSHWTHPGNIVDHLIKEHGYSYSQLIGKSEDQLLWLHDQAHEGNRVSSSGAVQRTVHYRQSYSSSCPGGICPTSKRERRFLRKIFGG